MLFKRVTCLRLRGLVDAALNTANRVHYWFARPVHAVPLRSFACTDWGAARLLIPPTRSNRGRKHASPETALILRWKVHLESPLCTPLGMASSQMGAGFAVERS